MTTEQTAVDWLFEKITSNFWDIKECQHLLEQAKEMEKQQMEKAVSNGISKADMTNNKGYFDFEQYYNETFNKSNQ